MTGNVASIDFSVSNIWYAWRKFRKGKKRSASLEDFSYHLEANLFRLHEDLKNGTYRHGGYKIFYVTENKKRRIAVASIRDRVVHRILCEYLVPIYDPTFIPDVWSCRKGKGLLGAITRAQEMLHRHPRSFVWRADVVKFFDTMNRDTLLRLLGKKIFDPRALWLLKETIDSSSSIERETKPDGTPASDGTGIPIGNLTSQIFANIYLNEFDQFVKTILRPQCCLRYGDDFIVIGDGRESTEGIRQRATDFLRTRLHLTLHKKNNVIVLAKHGLHFLGMRIFPTGRTLTRRNLSRIEKQLTIRNVPSYSGLVRSHPTAKRVVAFHWAVLEKLSQ